MERHQDQTLPRDLLVCSICIIGAFFRLVCRNDADAANRFSTRNAHHSKDRVQGISLRVLDSESANMLFHSTESVR